MDEKSKISDGFVVKRCKKDKIELTKIIKKLIPENIRLLYHFANGLFKNQS